MLPRGALDHQSAGSTPKSKTKKGERRRQHRDRSISGTHSEVWGPLRQSASPGRRKLAQNCALGEPAEPTQEPSSFDLQSNSGNWRELDGPSSSEQRGAHGSCLGSLRFSAGAHAGRSSPTPRPSPACASIERSTLQCRAWVKSLEPTPRPRPCRACSPHCRDADTPRDLAGAHRRGDDGE